MSSSDWIKIRGSLFTHPKVVRIASALNANILTVVGGLTSAWCLFDLHSEDGKLFGYTPDTLDSHLQHQGFSAAMQAVGWLEFDGESLILPRFDTHNGQSAKRRANDTERKKSVRKISASETDKKRTREEKIREEIKPQQQPQRAGEAFAKPFVMHGDWKPDLPDGDLIALCQSRGVTLNPLDPVLQTEFRMHWLGTATARTGSQWVNAFVKSLHSQQVINANRDSKLSLVSGQKQSTGFVETHTDRSWAEGM